MNRTFMASPGHELFTDSDSSSFVCSIASSNETADDLPGPGRTVGKFYSFAGHHLEVFLGKAAERLGKGPRVTAERIRQRRAIVIHASKHGVKCDCRECQFLELSDYKKRIRSPVSIKKTDEKIKKDCKRLLKYVDSKVASTQKQAMDDIVDLSISDHYIRTVLKTMGATKVISSSVRIYFEFRYSDFDAVLLSSSRKALISLSDSEINTLLQEWIIMMTQSDSFDDGVINQLWQKIAPYLKNPETAFLVTRTLRRTSYTGSIYWVSDVRPDTIGCVVSSIKSSPSDFEWEECEVVFDRIFSRIVMFPKEIQSIIAECVLRYADKMPRVLASKRFQSLARNFDKSNLHSFAEVHSLKDSFVQGIQYATGLCEHNLTFSTLKLLYPCPDLQPLLGALACPLERAVMYFVGCHKEFYEYTPTSAEFRVYNEIVRYIDSTDLGPQARAWNYANFFVVLDIYRCDMMLQVLSTTNFTTTGAFSKFAKGKKEQCVPRHCGPGRTIYRHLDRNYNEIHLSSRYHRFCHCETVEEEEMIYPWDWILYLRIERGTTFSSAGLHPLVAGHNTNGESASVAWLYFHAFWCTKCHIYGDCEERMLGTITEGMKPEDLRIEVRCRHLSTFVVPGRFEVPVLRYAPGVYPRQSDMDEEGLDATGPFPWRSVREHKLYHNRFWARVVTAGEIKTNGEILDGEAHSLWDKGQNRLISDSETNGANALPCDRKGQTEINATPPEPGDDGLPPCGGALGIGDDLAQCESLVSQSGGHGFYLETGEVESLLCEGSGKSNTNSEESVSGSLSCSGTNHIQTNLKSSIVDLPMCGGINGNGGDSALDRLDMNGPAEFELYSEFEKVELVPRDEVGDIQDEQQLGDVELYPGDEVMQVEPATKWSDIRSCDECIDTGSDFTSDGLLAEKFGGQVVVSESHGRENTEPLSRTGVLLLVTFTLAFFLGFLSNRCIS